MDEETADDIASGLSETRIISVKQRRKAIQEKDNAEKTAPSTKPKEKVKADKAMSSTKPKEKADKTAPSTKPKEKADKTAPSTKPKEKADKTAPSTKPKEKTDKAVLSTKPKENGKATESSKPKKKTVFDLVCEAVEVSGETKKGISAQAIRKYVKSNHDSAFPNLDRFVTKALNKGLETGKLERPPASKDAKGATGFFRLAKILASKRTNIKTVKREIPEEYVSDSEATEKPEKPRKRTFSDTYIEEMRASATSTPKSSVKRTMPLKDKETKKAPSKKTTNLKEISDTEIVVKKTKRKSMKSYSSDTEVDFEIQKPKIAKEPAKKAKTDKPKMQKADSTAKIQKNKVKKLYDGGKENEAKAKSGKAKAK